jgi:hypothetical protein
MTDDEKNVLKQLSKMIAKLAFMNGVYEGVLKTNVGDWKERVEIANASPEFQALHRKIDGMQQDIEKLIEENHLDALLAKLPKGGLLN